VRLLRATLLLSSFLLLLLLVFPFCFVFLVYHTLSCLCSVTFGFEMKGWRQIWGWFSSLCRSLFPVFFPPCSFSPFFLISLCFWFSFLSIFSLRLSPGFFASSPLLVPQFCPFPPCSFVSFVSLRRNHGNQSLLFLFFFLVPSVLLFSPFFSSLSSLLRSRRRQWW